MASKSTFRYGPMLFPVILAIALTACTPAPPQPPPTQQAPPLTPLPTAIPVPPSSTPCIPEFAQPEIVFQLTPPADFVDWALADYNSDGLVDILVARGKWQSSEDFEVDVFVNDGAGSFSRATYPVFVGGIPQTQNPREIVTADFNGDGRVDVFIAGHGDDRSPFPGYQNSLILSNPAGKLVDATANLPQQSDFTHSAATADIDQDGDIDIYVGNIYGARPIPPQILLNDGTAHFAVARGLLPSAQADLNRNKYTTSLFVDVNNHTFPDLVLGADDFTKVSAVLLNDGKGHFALLPDAMPAKPFAPTDIALDIASTDLNGDSFQDLLISWTKGDPSYKGRYIQVLINDRDGMFSDKTLSRMPPQPYVDTIWRFKFIELADVDEDEDLDILTHVFMDQAVYLNNGEGTFALSTSALPIPPISWYALADVDGDGHKDLVSSVPGTIEGSEAFSVGRWLACP